MQYLLLIVLLQFFNRIFQQFNSFYKLFFLAFYFSKSDSFTFPKLSPSFYLPPPPSLSPLVPLLLSLSVTDKILSVLAFPLLTQLSPERIGLKSPRSPFRMRRISHGSTLSSHHGFGFGPVGVSQKFGSMENISILPGKWCFSVHSPAPWWLAGLFFRLSLGHLSVCLFVLLFA